MHHTIHTISVVMSWVVGQHQFQKQGSKAWYSVANIMNLGHQMINFGLKKTYHRKGSLESFVIGYHSAILHGNHFTFPSQKLFSILSLSLPQSKGLCSSQVHPNCSFSAAFFTQDSLFTYNFSSKQLLHWGRKLAYGSVTVYSHLFLGSSYSSPRIQGENHNDGSAKRRCFSSKCRWGNKLVVEPTHLQNMHVKTGIFPK